MKKALIEPRLLKTSQAARYLSMGKSTLREKTRAMGLAYVQFGQNWYYDRRDLDALIEQHRKHGCD